MWSGKGTDFPCPFPGDGHGDEGKAETALMNLPGVSRESGAAWDMAWEQRFHPTGNVHCAGGAMENREKERGISCSGSLNPWSGGGEFPLGCPSPWRVAGRVGCGMLGVTGMRECGMGFLMD